VDGESRAELVDVTIAVRGAFLERRICAVVE
jgi:hypothetical protein